MAHQLASLAGWGGVQLLVAPAAFQGTLRASVVAAAIGRGLEAAGLEPPDLCPVADGGEGTLEVLLGRLGGETAGARVSDPSGRALDVGFALLGDGSTALIEVAAASGRHLAGLGDGPAEAGTRGAGELIVAAVATGAEVVLVACGGVVVADGGAGALAAIEEAGGLGRAGVVALCDVRTSYEHAGPGLDRLARSLPRDPRGRMFTGAGGGLAGGLWAGLGAELRAGAPFVLEALEFDRRMRAAWAVVTGEGRLDRSTLDGKIVAEVATRARQAGIPAHAIVGEDALDRFDARILDLQEILTGSTRPEIEAAGRLLAERLGGPTVH
jgi:glycerate kinase